MGRTEEQTKVNDEFHKFFFLAATFFVLLVCYFSEVFTAHLESLWRLNLPFRRLRNCRCEFGCDISFFSLIVFRSAIKKKSGST